jgi:predicted AlkP superfamily pyrophosphatase or phosphodiesterase
MAEPKILRCGARRASWWLVAAGALLLTALAACGGLAQPSQPSVLPTPVATPTPPPPPRVALISIDGLRPDALTPEDTPNILALAERGSYTFAAQTIFPSTTLPGHASMLMGVEPSAHGITFDEYRETFELTRPTVFAVAHSAGKRTLMVVGKTKLKQLAATGTLDSFVLATRGDADVVNEAITLIPAGFDLLFVHLPQTDQVGHASGWMSAEYLEQLRQTDEAVGRLVSLLPLETTVIVTSDHGGQLKTHGSRDTLDMTIPWIIAGPLAVHRGPLKRPVRTVDTAPTVLGLLGLAPPSNCAGKLVSEAFEPQ